MGNRLLIIVAVVILCCFFGNNAFAVDEINSLLEKGRTAIENSQYEEAVNCLGELLTVSDNKSNDPKVIAFGSTVQAYGMMRLNNPEMNPIIKQYLEKAIKNDPNWEFPKELLKKAK